MKTICTLCIVAFIVIGCSDQSEKTNQPQAALPSHADEWFFLVENTQVGPLTEEALRDESRKGRLRGDTQVWSESLGSWQELKKAVPGITLGGSEEAGARWVRLYRQARSIPMPTLSLNQDSMTPSQVRQYLAAGKSVLDNARKLNGQYGPEPKRTKNEIGRLGAARTLARLLRHDIEFAVSTDDDERALTDMATLCSLARQMALSPAIPDTQNNSELPEEYFSTSELTSLATIVMMSSVILNPDHAEFSAQLKEAAKMNMGWTTQNMRDLFNTTFDATKNANPGTRSRMELTRELLGG